MKSPIAPGARFWETGWNTTVLVPVLWTSPRGGGGKSSGRSGPPAGDVLVRDCMIYCLRRCKTTGTAGISQPSAARKGKGPSLHIKCEVHCCTEAYPMRRTPTSMPSHPPRTFASIRSSRSLPSWSHLPQDDLVQARLSVLSRLCAACLSLSILHRPPLLRRIPACSRATQAMQVICMRIAGDAGDTLFGSPEYPRISRITTADYDQPLGQPIAGAASRIMQRTGLFASGATRGQWRGPLAVGPWSCSCHTTPASEVFILILEGSYPLSVCPCGGR